MATKEAIGFKNVSMRRGRIVIDGRQLSLTYEPPTMQKLNRWWDRDIAEPFKTAAQIWMNNQGAIIATRAGMNVEELSHEMAEDSISNTLIAKLSSSNGYHFEVEDIFETAKKYVRLLEVASGKSGWGNGFLVHFLENDLSNARNLSKETVRELRRSILQNKFQFQI